MTERISSDPSRNVCRRPEDDESAEIPREAPAPTCRDRLVSAQPIDSDRIPTSCDANAADAARNASSGGGMCGGRWPGTPVTSLGSVPEPRSDAPPVKQDAPSVPARTAGASGNAARTAERDFSKGPYAAAGRTHDGGSVFAGAAALKGRTEEGIEAEALSVSVQVGAQNEIQGTVARLGYSGEYGSGSIEVLTASVHLGIDNSDGSYGVNIGATASLMSGDVTTKHSGDSITAGLAAGKGGEAHVGIRDDDKDGKPEICLRVAWGVEIGGGCIELPMVIRP